jgi:NADH-quinone oxidoreductase subunit L
MRVPLVVLAIATAVGGLLDLPWAHRDTVANFLTPVFATTLYNDHASNLDQWVLALVDAAVALVGIAIAWALWRSRVDRPSLEPEFLRRVWYWDDFYDAVIGRPGQAFARFSATVVEGRIIDGAVNGVATLVRNISRGTRKVQTGYVRNYALGIALGLAAVLVFVASRTWWS